jgi:serine/threonine-protein kinase
VFVPHAVPLEADLEPFPGYRLRRRLGAGAFGEVWEATTPADGAVALKFLCGDHGRSAAQEIRTLQTIRTLRHPHLVRIDQVWCHLGYVVVAMELAEGNLSDLLEIYQAEFGEPVSREHASLLLAQAASALDFLNARRHSIDGRCVAIQHCDVKPSNLLLFGDKVKVADFGLSSWLGGPMESHRRAGTLDYCAPEVFQGRLSAHTDQYALAVSYCLLRGGRLPFTDTPSRFVSDYVRPAPDLSMLTRLEQPIIARALSREPHRRWSSCGELITRLARLIV